VKSLSEKLADYSVSMAEILMLKARLSSAKMWPHLQQTISVFRKLMADVASINQSPICWLGGKCGNLLKRLKRLLKYRQAAKAG